MLFFRRADKGVNINTYQQIYHNTLRKVINK